MLSSAEEVLRRLDLHYRVVTLDGDMGFAANKTYTSRSGPGAGAIARFPRAPNTGEFQARAWPAPIATNEGRTSATSTRSTARASRLAAR